MDGVVTNQYRANVTMSSSQYYLERAGFEAKVNFRHNLKNGDNLIGRFDFEAANIKINSMTCSRQHCVIKVAGDCVYVEDLASVNGTTVNGIKKEGCVVPLQENDLIGIIGGTRSLSELVGNQNYVVYRLRKYDSENIQTFEIEDDDPIELSDDEDDTNVMCLDSDNDEAVDIKEELDLEIQLSRTFNIEIKKELEELDEWEESNEFSIVKEEVQDTQCSDGYDTDNGDFCEINGRNVLLLSNGDIAMNNNEGDVVTVNDKVNVATANNMANVATANNMVDVATANKMADVATANNMVDVATVNNKGDVVTMNNEIDVTTVNKDIATVNGEDHNDQDDLSHTQGEQNGNTHANYENASPFSKQTETEKELAERLEKTLNKINGTKDNLRKRGPELISPVPLEKKRKSKASVNCRKKKNGVIDTDKKEKLKALASTSSQVNEKQISHTTPKVKFTPNNRGSFLTDATQTPGLPKDVKRKPKVRYLPTNQQKIKNLQSVPTPPELEKQLQDDMLPTMSNHGRIPFLESDPKLIECHTPVDMEIDSDNDSGSFDSGTTDCRTEHANEFLGFDMDLQTIDEENEEPTYDDADDDEDIDLLRIIMELPPETCTITVIEKKPKPANLKSILKSAHSSVIDNEKSKRRVTFQQNNFQYDHRHKIISDITAFHNTQSESVVAFCRSADTNIKSFDDSYDDYKEYRSTLVALMMAELWKEIEIEYENSEIHSTFTTVTVNDSNLEKRGECYRRIFHCQAVALYKSQDICDGHLVFVKCQHNSKEIQFLALITNMAYSNRMVNQQLAYFTMETSAICEELPIKLLRIRPITVITNTLNAIAAIYALKQSPLKNLVMNPLAEENTSQLESKSINFKIYNTLDDTQLKILKEIYRRCINLEVPSMSLVDGGAGTGKTCMIANLALQLVYGDSLPKPLKILICSKTNGSINDLTTQLINIRNKTAGSTKIQVVRFGMLEQMDKVVQLVSTQRLKNVPQQFASHDDLLNQKCTLELKMTALLIDEGDHAAELKVLQKQLFKVKALLSRFKGLEEKKLRDTTTFILNSCDIICTTLGSVPKLLNYVSKVDVCIIDEATQCSEPLTLLPIQFGMPSLVLVGDSQLVPSTVYSSAVKERKYGNSLFARCQKLCLGKFPSPIFEMNFQYRMHQEILMWPNCQFYKNRLVPHNIVKDDNFPITPYKLLSYSVDKGSKESEQIMLIIEVLLNHVARSHSIGIMCTNFKQDSVLRNKLRDHPYITTHIAESYVGEKDVVVIWISEEHGIRHLAQPQILNTAVTRAKKSLLICGANLSSYKNRPVWRSLLENANHRNLLQHCNKLTKAKVCSSLLNVLLRTNFHAAEIYITARYIRQPSVFGERFRTFIQLVLYHPELELGRCVIKYTRTMYPGLPQISLSYENISNYLRGLYFSIYNYINEMINENRQDIQAERQRIGMKVAEITLNDRSSNFFSPPTTVSRPINHVHSSLPTYSDGNFSYVQDLRPFYSDHPVNNFSLNKVQHYETESGVEQGLDDFYSRSEEYDAEESVPLETVVPFESEKVEERQTDNTPVLQSTIQSKQSALFDVLVNNEHETFGKSNLNPEEIPKQGGKRYKLQVLYSGPRQFSTDYQDEEDTPTLDLNKNSNSDSADGDSDIFDFENVLLESFGFNPGVVKKHHLARCVRSYIINLFRRTFEYFILM
ncbi:Helicase SEN1 [Pseudolycoriella hygida]|uniref:Helicase SEN1 n=1 Tax=Pseudolycoriella hygida TaxID=35572 RepID=A0A9Q0N1R7_9DIPT|nr:Helicase SEN1 [Pseudolycoriella hygida]